MRDPLTSVTVNETDARDILFAECLEDHAAKENRWLASDRNAATRDAKRLAGEAASPAAFLAIRARLVASRLHEDPQTAVNPQCIMRAFAWLTLIPVTLAFAGGLLTDHLATEGARINLLSVPLLLVVLWNILVYAGLLLKAIVPANCIWRHLPSFDGLSALYLRTFVAPASDAAISTLKIARTLWLPKCKMLIVRALHLAAVVFAAGLLLSMMARGIGTAYLAGWESTWFAGNPEIVRQILSFIYGWLPFCPPIPDVSVIAAMAFDSPTANVSIGTSNASEWLLRLMCLIAVTIILPRSLLALWTTISLRRSRSVTLDLTATYYQTLFKTDETALLRITVIVDSPDDKHELPDFWLRLTAHLKTQFKTSDDVLLHTESAWDDTLTDFLAKRASAHRHQLLLAFDPASTPEEEVHGRMIDVAREWCATHHSPAPILLLNLSRLTERFGADAPALGSRTGLWQTFAAGHQVKIVALDMTSDGAVSKLCGTLAAMWDEDTMDNKSAAQH